MALSTNDFGKAVVAAGLLPADALKSIWESLPADARPKNADAFAKLLVTREKLTPFQASELLSGSGTPLVLGDLVLLAKIGAGGMGQVFKAQHRHMKRLVAVKLLSAALTKDEATVKRFQREVEAAAKLSHPNIVHANDASVQRGVWYLVMEYVEGSDLAHVVKARGPLPVEEAVNYITQAARGLAFAHSEGVVHRDIKPANLLLDKKGVVKILDMGLARFDDANPAMAEAEEGLTQSGQVMGTVDYMAPEQAFDTRQADARADIYSLGCSLYRLLIGENVYSGDTVMQKFLAHREKPIPSLREKRPEVSEELDAVFQKMMAKLPEDRYQPTSQLVADLEACASGSTAKLAGSAASSTNLIDSPSGKLSATEVEDGMTAALGNQFLRSLPDSRVVPRDDTYSSSVNDRTQRGRKGQKTANMGGKKPPWQNPLVLSAAGAGALLLLLLGVWVIVRDKEGKPVAKVEVPDGGSVDVKSGQETKKKPTTQDEIKAANENSSFKVGSVTPAPTPSKATSAVPKAPTAAALEIVYLDDLLEVEWIGKFGLGKHGLDLAGRPITRNGVQPMHALMTSPREKDSSAVVTYDLGGKYATFAATFIAANKEDASFKSLTARVLGDDRELWKSATLTAGSAEVPLTVSVAGVRRLQLEVVCPGEKAFARSVWLDPRLTPVASSLPAASGAPVDVLALIDPARHSRTGQWQLEKGVLVSPASAEQAVIELPVAIAASYRLEADVERKHTDGSFRVGLKVGDASCQAVLVANSHSGLSRVRNQRAFVETNPTRTDGPIFTKGQACRIVIDVTPTSVRVECDGRAAINWKGDAGELSDDPSSPGVPNKLWLGTSSRVFKISKLSYTPLVSGQQAAGGGQSPATSPQSPTPSPSPTVPAEALTFGGHRYLLVESLGTWAEAKAKAEAMGGHLATINSQEERDWVFQNVWLNRPKNVGPGGGSRIFLGGTRAKDKQSFEWVTGEPFDMTLWLGDGPDEKGVAGLTWYQNKNWDDVSAGLFHPFFLVEWDSLGSAADLKSQISNPKSEISDLKSQTVDAALKFDSGNSVDIPGLMFDAAQPYTIEIVVTSPEKAAKGDGRILGFGNQSSLTYTKGGNWRWVCQKVSGDSGSSAKHAISNAPHDAERTHLACVHEGTKYWLYYNGKLFQSTEFDDAEPFQPPFTLGGNFIGVLDELRVSKVARYKAEFKPPTARFETDADTLGLYHFDEGTGNELKDTSGHNRHGKITGTKWVMADGSAIVSINPQSAIGNPQWNTPAFQQWMKDVQAMPAEQQIEAVSKKLMELNPGFDGKLTFKKIESNVVTDFGYVSDMVKDISPVRALAGLKRFQCEGSDRRNGALSDLSPLQGLKLTLLACSSTNVSDLSPLQGMPLTLLNCCGTRVVDLSPLQGMPLANLLCAATHVSNLSPLKGMPLTSLDCPDTQVSDLSPLKGLLLTRLVCYGTQVSDLSPLKDSKSLITLRVGKTKVTAADAAALQNALPNCKVEWWDDPAKAKTPEPAPSGTK